MWYLGPYSSGRLSEQHHPRQRPARFLRPYRPMTSSIRSTAAPVRMPICSGHPADPRAHRGAPRRKRHVQRACRPGSRGARPRAKSRFPGPSRNLCAAVDSASASIRIRNESDLAYQWPRIRSALVTSAISATLTTDTMGHAPAEDAEVVVRHRLRGRSVSTVPISIAAVSASASSSSSSCRYCCMWLSRSRMSLGVVAAIIGSHLKGASREARSALPRAPRKSDRTSPSFRPLAKRFVDGSGRDHRIAEGAKRPNPLFGRDQGGRQRARRVQDLR